MKSHAMNIVIAVNQIYVPYAYVMLTSLLCNNPCPIDIFVLHRDLTEADENTLNDLSRHYPASFHYIYIPDSLLPPDDVLASTTWGIETYFRLTVIDLLPPELDRAIYLDSDMIVNGSLAELYFCDFGGKKIAACCDLHSSSPFGDYRDDLFHSLIPDNFIYFNAGLTLFNLTALRPDYGFSFYMDAARKLNYNIQFPDQDLLNYCHHKDVLYFDFKRYNLFARRAYTDYGMHYDDVKRNTTVIHYTNSKPWQGDCLHCDIEQLWWDYAAMTPFYHRFMKKTVYEIITNPTLRNYTINLQLEHQQLEEIVKQYETLLKKAGIPF